MDIERKNRIEGLESDSAGERLELRFICPICGGNSLYFKQIDISEVVAVYSDAEVTLGDEFPEKDLGFFCHDCGYELRDKDSAVTFRAELVAWLLKNCPQTDEGVPVTQDGPQTKT